MKLFLQLFIINFSLLISVNAQDIAIGEWRDHLPYKNCVAVAEAQNKIYCATKYCLFWFDKSDNSLNRLNKINGLSDFGVSTIKYNAKFRLLIIAYNNTNIDIIDNYGIITNLSDIKRKQILGSKTINNISFIGDNAYLACSFGIVVLNLDKVEIMDTYYIGPEGKTVNVNDIAYDGKNIYAASDNGIYYAPFSGLNLTDYNSWSKLNSMPRPDKKYNSICFFNNKIFTNQSNTSSDTVYVFNGSEWNKWLPYSGHSINSIRISYEKLIISAWGFIDIIDINETLVRNVKSYNPGWPVALDAIFDRDNILWIADMNLGLIRSVSYDRFETIIPEGPSTNKVLNMSLQGNKLWVTSGGKDDTWNNLWYQDGVFLFSDNHWYTFSKDNIPDIAKNDIYDFISVAADPMNPDIAYIGTWSKGVLSLNDKKFNLIYDSTNSSLRPYNPLPNYSILRVGGIVFDSDNNMWCANPGADKPLSVKIHGKNKWFAYHLNDINNNNYLGNIVIDDYNHKWLIVPRSMGVMVFNDNGTLDNPFDDKSNLLTSVAGNGSLPSSNVLSIAIDLDGAVWVGTDQGVCVFYSPGNVFSGDDFDAQQILLEQDGHWQYLLQTELVTAIAVDGANRKWFGTQNSGVYLMSSDGTKQILHFTVDNSPLLSNTITCIAVNRETGEVFFGTNNGIISYKSTATEGKESFADKSSIYAYPNPVRENYDGPIAVKGFVRDADVKITSIDGNLVFATTALGGQAIWYGRNMDGKKVHSGVYLVFASNDDGSQTLVTKILFIK